MLIHRLTHLSHGGLKQAKAFSREIGERDLAECMKNTYKLVKKVQGYSIMSISNPLVWLATQILIGMVMWKCCMDEVLAPVMALMAQCAEGVQFNWVNYLCGEFLANYHEA